MESIVINGRFLLHRTTGVERYAREILEELDKIILPGSVTMAVPPETENIPTYTNIRVVRVGKFVCGSIFRFHGMYTNKKEFL